MNKKNSPLIFAIAVLPTLLPLASTGATLYFNTMGNPVAGTFLGTASSIDNASAGTLVGDANAARVTTPSEVLSSGAFAQIEPSPPSPAGGNYLVGPSAGQGNFENVLFNSSIDETVTATGQIPTLVDGTTYDLVFWMKPSVFTDSDGDQFALIPGDFEYNGGLQAGSTINVSWSAFSWSEVRIPWLYEPSNPNYLNFLEITYDIGTYQQVGGSGAFNGILSSTNTRATQIDYGVPIPEPTSSVLLIAGLAFGAFARKRR